MEVLNPGTGTRRFESAERLGADLVDAAIALPDRDAQYPRSSPLSWRMRNCSAWSSKPRQSPYFSLARG